ncbi:tetratricopeptide repeat protein [Kineosporia sp. NBRC 101731]|uniref:ATP-binding protein n=1 Tax=Kineosporia sp. NBRC 101731 TaxID=3032199 RepID=UPI0024A5FE26|nr:tetratricopeptide repeat protein [Kineosporia sp. NBRC 101731]GLY31483.1 hypothetical protein Kisp02_48480 [Kineosporia sp. NBRC 101731]
MGVLARPELPPGDLRTLSRALHEAHHRAGRPSLRDLAREVGCSRTTVSAVFSEPRPPRWGLLELVVEALGADPEPFHQMWLRATGDEPPDGGPPASVIPTRPVTPAATLRQAPSAVNGFIGRDALIDGLDALLRPEPFTAVPIGVLTGTAGVGKTSLARQWAHRRADRFPDGTLYVDLHGYHRGPTVAAHDVLGEFIRALSPATVAVPEGTRERAALYRSLLADQRVLVLLDNARTAEQVDDLLPGNPGCAAVVTSRDALGELVVRYGAERFEVSLMTDEEARELLSALVGDRVPAEPGPVAALIGACARLPLALRIAAELITSRPQESLADLVDELQARDLLDGVRTVFSWSYEHLDPASALLFRRLGLHPGPHFQLAGCAALLDCDLRTVRAAVDGLTRSHLLERLPGGRFRMHDLLRGYACELSSGPDGPDGTDGMAARTRLFDLCCRDARSAATYSSARADPKNRGQQWLSTERATLMAVAQASGRHAVELSGILAPFLDAGAHYDDAEMLHGLAFQAGGQNAGVRAGALDRLGLVHRRRGSFDRALGEHQLAIDLFTEAGDDAGLGRALQNTGIIHWRCGRYPQARQALEQALALHRAVGERSGEGSTLFSLGIVHRRLGDYPRAAACHGQAVALLEEIGDQVGLGKALNNLAALLLYRGEPEPALTALDRSLAIQRRLGDRAGESAVLANLGLAQERLGHLDEAQASFRLALRIADEIAYPVGRIDALRGLGLVLARRRDLDAAIGHLREAVALAGWLGEGGAHIGARRELGEVLWAHGAHDEATAVLTDALQAAEQAGDRYEQAMTLVALRDPQGPPLLVALGVTAVVWPAPAG